MTEIPIKQGGQTWANYFIERLKERGADAHVELPDNSKHEDISNATRLYRVKVGHQEKPEVYLILDYVWRKDVSRFPDADLNFPRCSTSKYDGSGAIEVSDSEGNCFIQFIDNDHKIHGSHAEEGTLEELLPEGITTAEALCNLADFVKQRQDFYKSEGQK